MPQQKKSKKDDLDFQMAFYEGIVEKRPHFVDALIALGEIYTKKGYYEKGLKVDKKLTKLRPDSPIVHYNLACSHSLIGDIASSFKAITRAIELCYDDLIFMANDPDLTNLRQDERFGALVKNLQKGSVEKKDATRG